MKLFPKIIFFFVLSLYFPYPSPVHSYASDDSHNHDGSHSENAKNCGENYMLPGETARLGSHSFMILGQEDEHHILAEHRSGTPPHNYQFVLRVRLDDHEMSLYKKILEGSKTLPAFTTIYFDGKGQQQDRTFFCLEDLSKIFGADQKKSDEFEKLFPIRASLQKNADHEGSFEIRQSVVPGAHLSLERGDVKVVFTRYLPAYLEQSSFRKAIKARGQEIVPRLNHNPIFSDESLETASKRSSYRLTDGLIAEPGGICPRDLYLPRMEVPKTIHNFLLMAEVDPNTVLAIHYYDQAPHNFQTALKLKLSDKEMSLYRLAKKESKTPLLLQTRVISTGVAPKNFYFCMADLRELVRSGKFAVQGTLYKDSSLNDYRLGQAVGVLDLDSSDVSILVNRNLNSFMNPVLVAKDVLKK